MITRPMLAAKIGPDDVGKLSFPVIVTPKLDGIRCIVQGGKALTRSFKPVPNDAVRACLERAFFKLPGSLDGELMVNGTFQDVSSGIMSRDGSPDFTYHVFDWVTDVQEPYQERLRRLQLWAKSLGGLISRRLKLVPFIMAGDAHDLAIAEQKFLLADYEGVCLRTVNSPYKEGRSTLKEQYLVALKRFVDSEAVIIGFEEKRVNTNPRFKGELGQTKKSTAKEGLIRGNTLGALLVRDMTTGVEFSIGTGIGFDDKLKKEVWGNRASYLGKMIKYRYQAIGTKDAPRIPSFQGFRDARDL